MSSRDELLTQKEAEIRRDLEAWTAKNAILGPGEQLVFTSLRVQKNETVIRDTHRIEDILNMKAIHFFSRERLKSEGGPPNIASRVMVCIRHKDRLYAEATAGGKYKVSEFLRECSSATKIRDLNNIGNKSAELMIRTMRRAGIPFDDH
ncbi:MAG: hypothetical protein Q8P23_00120 [bacterium]|nr:hypothetical protein [bacterium]